MTQSDERLRAGIAAYKQGRKQDAGRLFAQAIKLNPNNGRAWLWLSDVVDSDEQRRVCLERALALNPDNAPAWNGLRKLSAVQEESRPSPPPEPSPPQPDPIPITEPVTETAVVVESPPKVDAPRKKEGWLPLFLGVGVVVLLAAAAVFLPNRGWLRLMVIGNDLFRPSLAGVSMEEEAAVFSAIYENIAAANAENVDRYMASIHSQSHDYETIPDSLERLYQEYDLTVTIRNLELTRYSTDEAWVSYTLVTRRRNGPAFQDNRMSGTFIMRPEGGDWKLYDQVVMSRVDLE